MSKDGINPQDHDDKTIFNDGKDDKQIKPEKGKCVVIMPYGKRGEYSGGIIESRYIYECIIAPAVNDFATQKGMNLEPYMEFQNQNTGSITKSILENIAKAEICIVDITGHNPNVFFELGVRYSLRDKTTILLRQEKQDKTTEKIPFDIQGFRCLTYNPLQPQQSRTDLCSSLISSQDDHPKKTDSLVFETFKTLEVRIPQTLTSLGEDCDNENLSWEDWWKRINEHANELRKLHEKYDIHVVLGIANGGLLVADLLGRLVFKDVPILSLWADRRSRSNFGNNVDRSCYFFDNPYNQGTMKSIRETYFKNVSVDHKIGILLLDDLIYTSNTALQAHQFIKKELQAYEDKYNIFFAPLYCRRSSEIPIQELEDILICNYMEGCNKNDYLNGLQSKKRKFPYDKDLY